jgi:hypothetical protein
VLGHVLFEGCDDLVFTAFCVDEPFDVLTERMVGCGWAAKGEYAAFWFDVGNFALPWCDGAEVLVIVEALQEGCGQYAVLRVELDGACDVQVLDVVTLLPVAVPVQRDPRTWSWLSAAHDDVVGYSLYHGERRLNSVVIEVSEYVSVVPDPVLRLVVRGGYETVYGSHGAQGYVDEVLPARFAFAVSPNPFSDQASIRYALPGPSEVSLVIYDVMGRQVCVLVEGRQEPGYYDVFWSGTDDQTRAVSAGVYFVQIETSQQASRRKIVYVQ